MTESLNQCRKDDEEFLRQCLVSFQATNPENVNFDGVVKYILDGLEGYTEGK